MTNVKIGTEPTKTRFLQAIVVVCYSFAALQAAKRMIAPSVWDVLVVIPVLFYFLPGKNQRVTAVLGTAIGTVYLIAGGFMVWVGCATYGKQWLQVGLPLVAILIPFCLLAIVGSMRGLRLGAANLSALIMAVVGTLGISTWSGIVLGL